MKFTDMNGREWSGTLTLGTCSALAQSTGVDLVELTICDESQIEGVLDSLRRLQGNMKAVLAFATAICCEDEKEAKDLTFALDAPTYARIRQALQEEILHFFPEPARPALARLLEKDAESRKQTLLQIAEAIDPLAVQKLLPPELLREMALKEGQKAFAALEAGQPSNG